MEIAEIFLYGDVVLRLLNKDRYHGAFLPQFEAMNNENYQKRDFGLKRFDHIVSNVWKLESVVSHLKDITVSVFDIFDRLSPRFPEIHAVNLIVGIP